MNFVELGLPIITYKFKKHRRSKKLVHTENSPIKLNAIIKQLFKNK